MAIFCEHADSQPLVEALERAGVPMPGMRADRTVSFESPMQWPQHRAHIAYGFVPIESDEVPAAWIPRLGNVEELWCPSEWNVETLRRFTHQPVHQIRPGIDTSVFDYRRRMPGSKLRFLHISDCTTDYRSGVDLAIKAFGEAFPIHDNDKVELVLMGAKPCNALALYDQRISRRVQRLSAIETSDLFHGFDALVYTSRTDAFGRVPLEAMATGLPVIFADAGSLRDLRGLGMALPARRVPANEGVRGLPIRSTATTPFGWWHECASEDLAVAMHDVATEYDQTMDDAEADAKTIAAEWSWDQTAAQIVARLRA